MKLLKKELHDPCFCLGDHVQTENADGYDERTVYYMGKWSLLMQQGGTPPFSMMVWQG